VFGIVCAEAPAEYVLKLPSRQLRVPWVWPVYASERAITQSVKRLFMRLRVQGDPSKVG
jgi:hypothetical protein